MSTYLEEAEQEGFAQGWFDGLHGQPSIPRLALSPGLFDLAYMKRFKSAYLDGHATATKEMQRRKILLQSRSLHEDQILERDDV